MKVNMTKTVSFSEEDIKELVKTYLGQEGYDIDGEVHINIKNRCTGYGMDEHYEYFLDSVSAKVVDKDVKRA